MPRSIRRGHVSLALVWFVLAMAGRPDGLAAQVGATTDIITGVVTGADGKPISDALVEATSLDTRVTRQQRTNDRGRYTILFPEGGGQYRMSFRYVGMTPRQLTVTREADEDRLVADVQLTSQPVQLDEIVVRGRPQPRNVDRPTPGSVERNLSPDQIARLPIDATDLNILATLVPGVVGVDATDTTAAAFSVAGQRTTANNLTLDGLTFGSGSIPQDALRSTRVITSTYDVARGQFSGGLIAATTRSGTNVVQGSGTYTLRSSALSISADSSAFGQGYTQNLIGGGLGGPFQQNRFFGFGSLQGQFRDDAVQSLLDADPATLERLGVSPDSVSRFLTLVTAAGVPVNQPAVDPNRSTDSYTGIGRLDFNLSDAHTLTLRGDWRHTSQEPFRISSTSLPQTGGTSASTGGGGMAILSSRFGSSVINELRAYLSGSIRSAAPLLVLPEGRVQVTSQLADGSQGISMLSFGGGTSVAQSGDTRALEITDEVSLIPGSGAHRLKLGTFFNSTHYQEDVTPNRYGTFTYNSLADLEANLPASFTRTLGPRVRQGTAQNYALYLGDVWRRSAALQLTYGVRFEGAGFSGAPAYNPLVDSVFGLRTDHMPSEVHLSPRVGVTWTAGRTQGFLPRTIVRGGVGEFRSPAPTGLFASAQNATGLAGGEQQLFCVGSDVPAPEWSAYLADPSAIPTACAGGSSITSAARPNVTVFDPHFTAPRSWRTSLGIVRRLSDLIAVNLDASYARGVSQYGFTDRNLNPTVAFRLADEGNRPVYVPSALIVPGTGAISMNDSRLNQAFGQVFEINSALASDSKQLTLGLNGITRKGAIFSLSYTYSRSRDQSSFSCCAPSAGFSSPTTAGDPNSPEWATSDFERRHAFLGILTYPLSAAFELTTIARFTSGVPYTPRVAGDINGDGTRNDRAFVYGPGSAPDTAIADGMSRLLQNASGRVRDCLESQEGQVAGRNSCAGPWQPSLDLQANWRPAFLGLNRRLAISLVTVNLLRGVDDLLHGSANAHGWGQPARPDPTLLSVTGFDPAAQRFTYTVNERFGATGGTANAIRMPFQIGLQMRFTIGPDRRREALQGLRGQGQRGGGARPGAGGPGGGPGGAPGGPGAFLSRLETLLPNPATGVLALRDSLKLLDDQVSRLRLIEDSLTAKNTAIASFVRTEVEKAGANPDPARLFALIRPKLQEGRTNLQAALKQVQEVLTLVQWALVPEEIKNAGRRFGGPGGGGPRQQ